MSQGSNFVDYVKICCRSGHGGGGSSHLHRDILTSKGGPDGGDGGRGGDIIVVGNAQLWTLLHLKYRKHIIAGDGEAGGSSLRTGKSGRDEILEVPLGTIAKDAETGETLFEITQDGETRILTKGGRGGLGNWHFRSATQQTPRFAQTGEPGLEEWNILELKGLADVGRYTGHYRRRIAGERLGIQVFEAYRAQLGTVVYDPRRHQPQHC